MKKTILITGSSSGIGKATAQYFSQNGWNVAATMRKPEDEKDIKESSSMKLYQLDVQDEDSILKTIEKVISDFGKIDVVLNNAGYGARGPFEAASKDQIRRQFDVNVFGLMAVIEHILPYFRQSNSGTIIKCCSTIVTACLRRPPDIRSVPISEVEVWVAAAPAWVAAWVAAWAVAWDEEEAAARAAEAVGAEAGAKWPGAWLSPALIRLGLFIPSRKEV